jgi:hypothetical protein
MNKDHLIQNFVKKNFLFKYFIILKGNLYTIINT